MKRSTRMLLMNSGRTDRHEHGMEHRNYGSDPEYRFHDRRGREHYDDGRYAPMSAYDGGYRHYEPYIPPVYENRFGYRRDDMQANPGMHRIGFAVEGEMERMPQGAGHEYHHSSARSTKDAQSIYRVDKEPMPFTKENAMEWTGDMENADGSKGPHWSMEQVRQVMDQRGIDCDPLQFFAVLNSVYSDYCTVAKKHGIGNKIDFYVDLAKAWLEDADAVEDKAARYFEYIVKH